MEHLPTLEMGGRQFLGLTPAEQEALIRLNHTLPYLKTLIDRPGTLSDWEGKQAELARGNPQNPRQFVKSLWEVSEGRKKSYNEDLQTLKNQNRTTKGLREAYAVRQPTAAPGILGNEKLASPGETPRVPEGVAPGDYFQHEGRLWRAGPMGAEPVFEGP